MPTKFWYTVELDGIALAEALWGDAVHIAQAVFAARRGNSVGLIARSGRAGTTNWKALGFSKGIWRFREDEIPAPMESRWDELAKDGEKYLAIYEMKRRKLETTGSGVRL